MMIDYGMTVGYVLLSAEVPSSQKLETRSQAIARIANRPALHLTEDYLFVYFLFLLPRDAL